MDEASSCAGRLDRLAASAAAARPGSPAHAALTAARLAALALLLYLQMLITEAARGAPDGVIEALRPWFVPGLASARQALAGASWTLWALTWLTATLAAVELGRALRRARTGRSARPP